MLTKRGAIIAIYLGVLAKMAKADQPPISQTTPSEVFGSGTFMVMQQQPSVWSVNMDQMKQLDVYLGKDKVTITASQIMDAIRGT